MTDDDCVFCGRMRLTRDVSRYLCGVTGKHSPEAVVTTATDLAARLTSNRADRELLASILTGSKAKAAP